MAGTLKHAFTSAAADSTDASKVRASNWNADHTFSGGVHGDGLIRSTGASQGAVWSSELASLTPTGWFNYAAWGDSLTAGTGGTPYTTTLATSTGQTVYNGGVGGETSTQIKTRFVADTTHNGGFVIIWAGRNNFTDPTTVKADIAAMVAALSHSRYLILSILNGTGELSGSANYTTLTQLNTDLAALYPSNYLDIRAYLVSLFDAGQPQDVIDHGNDIPPSSLRSDAIHLNTAGYTAVATRINTWLAANDLGGRAVARLSDVLGMFAQPPSLGSSTNRATNVYGTSVYGTTVLAGDGAVGAPSLSFENAPTMGFYSAGAAINVAVLGGLNMQFGASGPILSSSLLLRWGSSGVSSPDLVLARDAANVLAQRNGTNNQGYNLYETFTDTSNYSRLRLIARPGNSDFAIYTDRNGTGVARPLSLGANGALSWQIATAGGHFVAITDNSTDIGSAGANRPRNIFVSSSVVNKTKAGTPTDSDVTNAADGMLVVDTTANKIWVRTGGAWKGVAVA